VGKKKNSDIAKQILQIFREDEEIHTEMSEVFAELENPSDESPSFATSKLRQTDIFFANLSNSIGTYNSDRIPVSTYDKMLLDPDIALGRSFVVLPILAQNFRIDSTDTDKALVVQSLVKKIYRELMRNMLTSYDYGFSVGEKIFEKLPNYKLTVKDESGNERIIRDGYTIGIKKVKYVKPSSVSIVRDKKTEEIKYVKQENYYTKRQPKVKYDKVVWFAMDEKFGNVFGISRLKPAYQPWYWYQIIIQFMLRYLDRTGSPTAVARAPRGTTVTKDKLKVDNMDVGLAVANAVSSNSSIVLSSDLYAESREKKWDVKFLEDTKRGDMFLEALRFLSVNKMRAMLIPDKVGVSEGSNTNATGVNNTDIHLLSEEALVQQVEDVLNKSVVNDLIKYNWPPEERFHAQIKIERLNHGKRNLLRDTLLRMLMFAGGVSDTDKPKTMPSIKDMCEFLEIPYEEYDAIFTPEEDGSEKTDIMKPTEKADAKDDSNEKSVKEKKRTQEEINNRKRYFEKGTEEVSNEV